MKLKYKLSNCENNYDEILEIFNKGSNNFILTKIKNSFIIKNFCTNKYHIIYLKNKTEIIGFLIFNIYSNDSKNYIIINAEYLCVIKEYQSMGLSTVLLKYLLKKYEKIIYKITSKKYKNIYISAIMVNPRSFSKLFDMKKTFPVSKNKLYFNKEIINDVKKLNSKFIYLSDYICFNLFAIKIKILFENIFGFLNKNKTNPNDNLKYYYDKIGLPIGMGFYVSVINKLK